MAGSEIDEFEEEFEKTLNQIINFINEASPRFQKIEESIANINIRFEEVRGEFDSKLEKLRTQFEEKRQTVMTRIDEVDKKLEEKNTEINTKLVDEIAAQNQSREELKGTLETTHTQSREEIEEMISETNRNLQALGKNLGGLKLELNEKNEAVLAKLVEKQEGIDAIHEILKQQEEKDNSLNQLIMSNNQLLENQNAEFQSRKQEVDNINNELFEFVNTLKESIIDTNKIITSSKVETDNRLTQMDESFQSLQNQMEVLNEAGKNLQEIAIKWTEVSDSQSQNYHALQTELQTFSEQVKQDQAELLQSTQRIVQGIAGDLRTEIILANKTAREMFEEYRKEIQGAYYSITDGQQLQEEIKGLEREYIAKAERIRDDLMNSLKENIKTMETRTQKSIDTVRTYKAELDDYKDDITVFIERRVAEKMDWIHDILVRTAKKTEELKHEIRQVQIVPAERPPIVVPTIEKAGYKSAKGLEEESTPIRDIEDDTETNTSTMEEEPAKTEENVED
ncbi:MAG: hypothetical protein ACFFBD_29095 [Candidatus Hodarchaeota archaeon]